MTEAIRLGPTDRFWLVLDPTPQSVLADVLTETSLAGLFRQFRGGLTMDQNPTILTDEAEARAEAEARLRGGTM